MTSEVRTGSSISLSSGSRRRSKRVARAVTRTFEKRVLAGAAVAAVAVAAVYALGLSPPPPSAPPEAMSASPHVLKFASLSGARTNFCAGPDFMASRADGDRLQGSCCSPMDFHRYVEQVEGLKRYAAIPQIPPDPYDIPVTLAKELLGYQKTIRLTPGQQATYDEAVKMSHEKGPCCCKCWRWYAFEGQAKYLIARLGYTAKQVAEVWDLEDGCGGRGHAHGGMMDVGPRQVFHPQ